MTKANNPFGPWNPGLNSTIPERLMPLATIYDPSHGFVPWDEARALADVTGLKPQELAVIRPERLALHSVLIRVTTQLFVPDGPNYADLGINLRAMAARIHDGIVQDNMDTIVAAYDAVGDEAAGEIARLLDTTIYGATDPKTKQPGLLARLFARRPKAAAPPDPTTAALAAAQDWRSEHNLDVPSACKRALARTLGSILNQRGALLADRALIEKIARGIVLNRLGSAAVGRAVETLFDRAVTTEGYTRLPRQDQPVVLNAKGASASGKSTIRHAQRQIAERRGLSWQDFAIISPDYWRKALIDYDGLGDDYKYAAMLCGQELEMIDRKLDILMTVKGKLGDVPHMLIDRFRFDSFEADRVSEGGTSLLTRFGSRVFMFFMITPPAATVERAWKRGLETGRYKAVDDLIYHNIEAYEGMPDLFFGWALGQGRWVHYEFLDNSVAQGTPPRSVAYGRNGKLVIRDLERLCDVDRFRVVNVDAKRPEDLLPREQPLSGAMTFVRATMAQLDCVEVLNKSGAIYARARRGVITVDPSCLPEGFDPACFGPHKVATSSLGYVDPADQVELIGS